jgi:hypothetical protein
MKPNNETPMTFGERMNQSQSWIDASEELDWLMSLALDDALDEQEAARFEQLLAEDASNADCWDGWRAVGTKFQQAPCALPPLDFGEKFAMRLEIHERRRRLRTGLIFGLAAVLLWSSALAGMVMLGALIWSNQGMWLNGAVVNFSDWWTAVRQFGQAMLGTGAALWEVPQTRALVLCYVVAAAAILSGWLIFLRRSTRELDFGDAVLVEG